MSLYEFGPFQLDAARLLLLEHGEPISIGPKVVETLLALIEHPGEVFPKGELLARIWPEGYVDEANLAQNVYVLRKTLRRSWDVESIETIPRRGYRFVAAVQRQDGLPRPEPAPGPITQPPLRPRGWVLAAAFAVALLGGSALTTGTPSTTSARSDVVAQDTRLYAMGRYYWNTRTPDGVAKSLEYFSRIVANDPRDVRGYAGLALANAIMADYGYGSESERAEVTRARADARKALAIDPNSSDAYAVLGLISSGLKDLPPQIGHALADLRRAIALDPASGTAHQWYGEALLQQGRVNEAYVELGKAAQLDPVSVATTAWLGTVAYLERDYRDAISYARETLDLSPQRSDAYETLGLAYEALGDQPQAGRSFGRLAQTCPSCRAEAAALLTALYARTNRMDRAHAELTVALAHTKEVMPEDLALALAAVGQRSAALALIRRWKSDSSYAQAELANDPRFAQFRDPGTRQQKSA
jgi:DNA-binding winged helix-turn-helix (wHTH) protein/tetratricopeptide (TPR) repeat protein